MQLIRAAHKPDTASKQPTETFTGTVHMVRPSPFFQKLTLRCEHAVLEQNEFADGWVGLQDPIFNADDCMGNNVCFTPGARTFWHTHERGQVRTHHPFSPPPVPLPS